MPQLLFSEYAVLSNTCSLEQKNDIETADFKEDNLQSVAGTEFVVKKILLESGKLTYSMFHLGSHKLPYIH